MHRRLMLVAAVAAAVALVVPAVARADAVTLWNDTAADVLMTLAGQGPTVSVPHMAMVHGAVYDAVNAIDGGHEGYLLTPRLGSPTDSKEAAVAAAARGVLVSVFSDGPGPARPDLVALVEAKYALALATIPDGTAKTRGIAVGEAAAAAMIAARTADGRYGPYRFPVGFEPGVWHPPFPPFTNDPAAWIKDVDPFLVESPTQFGSKGPDPLSSRRYADDFEEVKELGELNSTARSSDQTLAARYWAENPPRTWSRITRTISAQQGLSLVDNARLFAMLYMTAADTFITVWTDKAHFLFWRPVTAIRMADTDGNRRTAKDEDWQPLIANPPYPEHPSGHLGLSGSFVITLREFLGTDKIEWTDTNVGGLPREFDRLSDALDEVVGARIWSGIHFRNADEQSVKIARQVAKYREHHYFGRVHD